MAEKYLRSITFPGLSDTYIIPEPDANLETTGVPADAKATGDALATKADIDDVAAAFEEVDSKKANIDGSYDLMNTGTSDNWTPYSKDSGATQDIPFINEATGGGNGESVVDTGSYLQFKRKLGNTVGVNQLCDYSKLKTGTYSDIIVTKSGDTLIANGTASANAYINLFNPAKISTISGHKYLAVVPSGTAATYYDNSTTRQYNNMTAPFIFTGSGVDIAPAARISSGTTVTSLVISMSLIDLTLWFGSNDRIPSDLLSHPENWGRYYAGSLAYNAGTLESADGTVMKSIGRNVWDEEWEYGSISSSTGQNDSSSTTAWRTKNYIPIIPNSSYYITASVSSKNCKARFYDAAKNYIGYKDKNDANVFTNTPFTTHDNAHFMRLSPSVADVPEPNHDITISLYYSGESGYSDYYPSSVLAEVDTGSEVLRSAGAVADEKTPDGTITRRVGVVDLGSLTWSAGSSDTSGYNRFISVEAVGVNTPTGARGNVRCAKYIAINGNEAYSRITGVTLSSAGKVVIYDETFAQGTAAAFKTAMSGVYLYYELATPTTEQGTAFPENIPCDDFGSLMWTQTKGIPQGNEIFYPVDYKASFDTLYNLVEGDMSALATDDELQEVADRIPEAPSEDGTYTLKATVSNGTKTYSWVADE